ncbi:MAG TPA: PAS domain S-box protein [Desulfonatronum sp.]|nr:PAS domain S-box protein [Desulfonatronum sp.]
MAQKKHPETSLTQAGFSDAQDILDHAPIGVFTSTPEGRYISANPALARMYGYESPEELIESITDIGTQVYADPEDRKEFIRLLEEHGEVTNHESRFRSKDGTVFWVSRNARVVEDKDGLIVAYQGFTTYITERKRVEEALGLERERFFLLLETFPGFIYLQSPDYSVRYANKYFIEHFGNPKGRLCYEVMWGRTAPCETCPTFKVFDMNMPQVWEWLQAPDGKSYAIHVYPFIDSDGSKLVLEVGIDITDRKQAEDGQQALDLLAAQDFDVILMDVQMPLINGVEATKAIRESASLGDKKDIPIIALTAYAMTGDKEKFLGDGMDDYLAKPVKMEDLAKVLERVVGTKQE